MIFQKDSVFKNIFIAGSILFMHVFLLAGIGIAAVIFGGVYAHLPWIMAFTAILTAACVWLFYRRIKTSSSDIRKILSLPEFQDRTIEIKLLGGLTSLKIEPDTRNIQKINYSAVPTRQLPCDHTHHIETRILELNALFEKKLITEEEFKTAKHDILHG